MSSIDRRQLLVGGAGALLGTSALTLGTASSAAAASGIRQVTFPGVQGVIQNFVIAGNYGEGRLGVTWGTFTSSGSRQIIQQWRTDYNPYVVRADSVRTWTLIPRQGRSLQLQPIDPAIGIFGPTTPYESYRINVNGFGILDIRAATQRVRIQVVGVNGRHYFGDFARFGNPDRLQDEINNFISQANTLNSLWATYRNTVRGLAGTTGVAIATALGLAVSLQNPVVIAGFIGAAATGGIALLTTVRNNLVSIESTYNTMIDTFNRIESAFGTVPSNIPRYAVGNVRWNNPTVATSPATFGIISG